MAKKAEKFHRWCKKEGHKILHDPTKGKLKLLEPIKNFTVWWEFNIIVFFFRCNHVRKKIHNLKRLSNDKI